MKKYSSISEAIEALYNYEIINGNHDNFLYLNSCKPNYTYMVGYKTPILRPNHSNDSCSILIAHGHEFDSFNNDQACGSGYLITYLLSLIEAKGDGDLLKKYEKKLQRVDPRIKILKAVSKCFMKWDTYENSRSKNKLVILAHTHEPYLDDITHFYKTYASFKRNVYQEKTGRQNTPHNYKYYIKFDDGKNI